MVTLHNLNRNETHQLSDHPDQPGWGAGMGVGVVRPPHFRGNGAERGYGLPLLILAVLFGFQFLTVWQAARVPFLILSCGGLMVSIYALHGRGYFWHHWVEALRWVSYGVAVIALAPWQAQPPIGLGWRLPLETNNAGVLFALLLLQGGDLFYIGFAGFMVFLSASRSAWAGLAVGIVVLGLYRRWSPQRWVILFVLGCIAAPIIMWHIYAIPRTDSRADLWSVAWQMLLTYPATGAGPDTFRDYWRAANPNSPPYNHAHSLYINVLAEAGLFGFAWLLILVQSTWQTLHRRYMPTVLAALAALLVASATEMPTAAPYIVFTLIVLVLARRPDEPNN